MKKISLILISMIFIVSNIFANEQIQIKNELLTTIDKIVQTVEDKTLSKDERNSKIVSIVTPMFDFKLMAKLSLGKRWRQLDKQTQQKFVKLYVQRMKKSYSSKLDKYNGEKVKIEAIKQPKKNRIFIYTALVGNTNKLNVVYKYYKPKKQLKDKNRWIIYDVQIEGVSILKADRAQFNEYLQSHSIEDLMKLLQR